MQAALSLGSVVNRRLGLPRNNEKYDYTKPLLLLLLVSCPVHDLLLVPINFALSTVVSCSLLNTKLSLHFSTAAPTIPPLEMDRA